LSLAALPVPTSVPKEKPFFQALAVAQLPISPVMTIDTLHQLQIHVRLPARVIGYYELILLRVSNLQHAWYSPNLSNHC